MRDSEGKRTGKKERKVGHLANVRSVRMVSSIRRCIVSAKKGMENDKDTVNETGREKEMRETGCERKIFGNSARCLPRGWVYIADHQTK